MPDGGDSDRARQILDEYCPYTRLDIWPDAAPEQR